VHLGGLNKEIMSNTKGFTEQIELHELREKCRKLETKQREANEFIIEIAKMLDMETDGIGYDGIQFSLDDFQDAICALGHEA
jgi:hypothetical protein